MFFFANLECDNQSLKQKKEKHIKELEILAAEIDRLLEQL